MTRSRIVVLATNLLFQSIDFRRKELDRTAACGAHHVMMAAAVVLVLVAGDSVVESHLAREAALRQYFQRAIHGGKSDLRILYLHQAVQFVGGEMFPGLEEGSQDGVSLRGLLQAYTFQVAVQDALGLANHFLRDAGLIVNALLQHDFQSFGGGRRTLESYWPLANPPTGLQLWVVAQFDLHRH